MTTNHHTPLATGAGATATGLNAVFGQLDSALSNLIGGALAVTQWNVGSATAVTISGGAITAVAANLAINTEAGASTDNLDTINGGADGLIIILSAADDTKTVVVKHGTGNISLASGDDLLLDDSNKTVMLIYRGSQWRDMSGQQFEIAGGQTFCTTGAIDSGTETAITWIELSYDTGGVFDGANDNRIYAPATGNYVLTTGLKFESSATGYRRIRIRKNGSTFIAEQAVGAGLSGGIPTTLSLSAIVHATAGDYFEVLATQTSGGSLSISDAVDRTSFLAIERLS